MISFIGFAASNIIGLFIVMIGPALMYLFTKEVVRHILYRMGYRVYTKDELRVLKIPAVRGGDMMDEEYEMMKIRSELVSSMMADQKRKMAEYNRNGSSSGSRSRRRLIR